VNKIMKRFLILGAVAVACVCASVHEASAWVNSNFGLGMNWSWQSGGNSLLCGLWRDGQPGGADFYPQHVPVYPRPTCCTAPAPVPVAPQVFCPPGAGAPAPVGPGGPIPGQAFRYSYRPSYSPYYGHGR